MRRSILLALFSILALAGSLIVPATKPAAAPPFYMITDLGTLPNSLDSYAMDINNKGQIVGHSDVWNSNKTVAQPYAFLWENGVMTNIGALTGESSYAYGINDNGQVAITSNGTGHGYLYSSGVITDIGSLGTGGTAAYDLNNNGQIVGSSFNLAGQQRAFLWQNGVMTDLGTIGPANSYSVASGINNKGQIVGDYNGRAFLWQNGVMTDIVGLRTCCSTAAHINDNGDVVGADSTSDGHNHAYLYSNGTTHDLGTLGGGDSYGYGINNSDQVVGTSSIADLSFHAFLYSDGEMIDLNTRLIDGSGWTLTQATAINDAGQIVGTGDHNGQQHAFLLRPLPFIPSNYEQVPVVLRASSSGW